jgi:hypothetical protein
MLTSFRTVGICALLALGIGCSQAGNEETGGGGSGGNAGSKWTGGDAGGEGKVDGSVPLGGGGHSGSGGQVAAAGSGGGGVPLGGGGHAGSGGQVAAGGSGGGGGQVAAGGSGGACYTPTGVGLLYESAGCGAATPQPKCEHSAPACITMACSCAGKVIFGCSVYFSEPWAYTFPGLGPDGGTDCDPNAH